MLPRSFSTSSDSKERVKKKESKRKRSNRGKVLVKSLVQSDALRERTEGEREAEEKVTRGEERRSKEGDVTRIVFHLCVVDVLINSVRFSFCRLHGVFHADSGGNV